MSSHPGDNRLQQFDTGTYERPNQPYSCGHACGMRCTLGPTPWGGCQAGVACQPVHNNGSWSCSRTKLQGGKCDDGPSADGECCQRTPPCSPRSSLRLKRGRFVTWCLAATIGAVSLMLSSSWRNTVLSPGPLSQHHAQIAKGQAESQCTACHAAAEAGLSHWAVATVLPRMSMNTPQSGRCLKCHAESLPHQTAMLPHNIPASVAEQLTKATEKTLNRSPRIPIAARAGGEVACAVCHPEHHGVLNPLTAVSNAQCSSCHQSEYHSFAGDHPDFDRWPYERRTRIAFDHVSHQARHFPAAKSTGSTSVTFECRTCHLESETGMITGVASYSVACAACHDEKIEQSYGDGIALLQLPMVDIDVLRSAKLSVGEWPPDATGDFDGELPSLTRVLLNTDVFARSALEQFGSDFEFMDVDPTNIDDLEAVADIIWGIKYLIYDLAEIGPTAFTRRIRLAFDNELEEEVVQRLSGHLSLETIQEMQRAWFPNLIEEVRAHRASRKIPQPTRVAKRNSSATMMLQGWIRNDRTFTLRFRPTGHANEFLTAWIQSSCSTNRAKLSTDFQALSKDLQSTDINGQCASCHSCDPDPQHFGKSIWNWYAAKPATAKKTFTKFSHDPHILLPSLRDCSACHQLNLESHAMESYAQADPETFESSFHPVSKQSCATCHLSEAAGDGCTQCHNYHVDSW